MLDALLGLTGMGRWELDLGSGRIYGDEHLKKMLAFPAEEWDRLSMVSWAERVHQDDLALFEQQWQSAQAGAGFNAIYRILLGDNRWRWVHDRSLSLVKDHSGRPARLQGCLIDITRRQEEQQRWQSLMRSVPGVVYTFKVDADGEFSFPHISERVTEFYSVTAAEAQLDPSCIFNAIHPDDLPRIMESIRDSSETLEDWRCDYRVRLSGDWHWVEGHSHPERQPDGSTVWHGLIYSVHERKVLEEQLRHLSITDELTGLYNRRHLLACMEQEIARYRRYGALFAIIVLDLDHFKRINDRYGHHAGDEVLKRLATMLRTRLRDVDIAGRTGGEEFLLLLPDTDETGAVTTADGLCQAMAQEKFSDGAGKSFQVTFSAGVATIKNTEEAYHHLWARADKALYRAKAAGRNRVICD